jgi:hypothetical protein
MSNIYLNEDNIDDLARMVTALLSEIWIMRDRMAVMEKMLADKTDVTSQALDDYVPSPEFSKELELLRDRMVNNVIGAPIAAKERSVDAILARAKLARPA